MNHTEPMTMQHEPRLIVPGDLIGATEAAQILGVAKSTVTRHVAAGKIQAVAQLDGKTWIFDRADVLAHKAAA